MNKDRYFSHKKRGGGEQGREIEKKQAKRKKPDATGGRSESERNDPLR